MSQTLRRDTIVAARGRAGGAQLVRLEGRRVAAVRSRGKHLLIDFEGGLTLHTHMGMQGSWHRYRPGERWRERVDDAVAVLETPSAVVVCFRAPTVELIQTRALSLHPVLSRLGPDLVENEPDLNDAVRRLRASPASLGQALLDQQVVAGIGNVYRSETLFIERMDPFGRASDLPPGQARQLLATAARLLRANAGGGERVTMPDASGARPDASGDGSRNRARWVYRRAGLPCRRCGTRIEASSVGTPPRRLYWCPTCQSGRPTPAP